MFSISYLLLAPMLECVLIFNILGQDVVNVAWVPRDASDEARAHMSYQ